MSLLAMARASLRRLVVVIFSWLLGCFVRTPRGLDAPRQADPAEDGTASPTVVFCLRLSSLGASRDSQGAELTRIAVRQTSALEPRPGNPQTNHQDHVRYLCPFRPYRTCHRPPPTAPSPLLLLRPLQCFLNCYFVPAPGKCSLVRLGQVRDGQGQM
jgi:hypothetical protein